MTQAETITVIVAAGGWVVAILQAVFGFFERKKKQNDEILLKTVEYFIGGTQKRSVGISLIEGLIKQKKSYDEIVVPLLANQFVYLLLSSDTESAIHGERNLVRIYILFKSIIESHKSKHWHSRNEVLDAIQRRLENEEKSTINIASQTLNIWQKELQH
jgi:hypothetical protein